MYTKAIQYLYAVFTSKLKTSKGKGLVKTHFKGMDARGVWFGLLEHYDGVVMKAANAKVILNQLVTYRMSSDADQVKQLEEHNNRVLLYEEYTGAELTPAQKYEYLSNFISLVDGLSDVDNNATLFGAVQQTVVTPEV